jgi:uncharacterized protein YbbC (DUF1343 family)
MGDIKPGIDNDISVLFGKRLGLITNPSGVNHELNSTIDLLFKLPNVSLVALFAPEHGLRGDKAPGEPFNDYIDPITGLPVYSLYTASGIRAPTQEQIEKSNIEMLVLDLQDVSSRCYTYISTMADSIKSAKNFSVDMVVLDRPTPLGAHDTDLQGPVLNSKFITFIGIWTIPLEYAMTMGELAMMFNDEMNIKHAGLHVVKNVVSKGEDPRSALTYENARWLLPSPNLPTLLSSLLYNGMVIFEALGKVSLGRGTTTPFEVLGAPYIDNVKLISAVNAKIRTDGRLIKLFEGIRIVPIYFIPSTDVFTGVQCSGIHLIPIHPESFAVNQSLPISLTLLSAFLDLYTPAELGISVPGLNIRFGNDVVYQQLLNKVPVTDIIDGWQTEIDSFKVRRIKYLLY